MKEQVFNLYKPVGELERQVRDHLCSNRIDEAGKVLAELGDYLKERGLNTSASCQLKAWWLLESNQNSSADELLGDLLKESSPETQAMATIILARNRKPSDSTTGILDYLQRVNLAEGKLDPHDLPEEGDFRSREALGWLTFATCQYLADQNECAERLYRRSLLLQDSPVGRFVLAQLLFREQRISDAKIVLGAKPFKSSPALKLRIEKLAWQIDQGLEVEETRRATEESRKRGRH